jgi:hypothetical protein
MTARAAIASVLVVAACPRTTTPPLPPEPATATPAEGITIAMYLSTGTTRPATLVDDRRWVELAGASFMLDRIDTEAELPTLVIEPLDQEPLAIRACTRERDGARALAPVRCRFDGTPGRRFVRVLHVAPSLAVRVNHGVMVTDVAGDDDPVKVITRYAISTPSWGGTRAQVTLHDRPPGGEQAPRAISHGTVVLDGGTALLVDPERSLRGHVRTVYDGAIRDPSLPATDPAWGRESRRTVQAMLDLEEASAGGVARLPPGAFDVRVVAPSGTRDVVVAPTSTEQLGRTLRLPLWPDDSLHGVRRSFADTYGDPGSRKLVQRIQLSVANASDEPRAVWIEERLRPARRREITGVDPRPIVADGVARVQVTVPPRGTQQLQLVIGYDL